MRLALALLSLLLAGCASDPVLPARGPLAFGDAVPVSLEWPGAEPVIASAPDGTLYVEGVGGTGDGNVNKVWRSSDVGATWTDITPAGPGQERSNDGFVAVASDGTVYAANVFSLTFQVYRSEDEGRTWTKLAMPPVPPLMHRHWILPSGDSTLHVAVEALPPSFAPYLAGLPPPEAEALDGQAGMWYYRSDDRGETWSAPVQIDPIVNFAGQSNMVVSADGQRLYVARYVEPAAPTSYTYDDGRWYLLASEDGGATWERREMFDLTSEMSTAVPSLAIDAANALHFAWSQQVGEVSRVMLSGSTDGGRTWSPPFAPTTNGTHAMAWIVPRGEGLGLMWYEAEAQGTASQVDSMWRIRYAEVDDPLGAAPIVRDVLVTPESVHDGNICAKGPACEGEEDRSLLDYPWMTVMPDGRVAMVFASTKWDRPSAFAAVAVQR